ncbi:acyl-CoA dehydrogenase family protein [Streptomyces sp. NPDC051662]|uniref:acyl-CoA dehydrogenase family protein n=1 Tax=Streptomyces sp. NPDC051662 TaxID=3154750 RepID=UPI00343D1ACF
MPLPTSACDAPDTTGNPIALMAALESVIEQTIAPQAGEVDATGRFPRSGVEALGRAGILGATSATTVGGGGVPLGQAVAVVRQIARSCGSTAMVVLMHYAATAVIEEHGPDKTRRAIAEGSHLTSLAFSEVGSRSHFWAPEGTAMPDGDSVLLDARKSWVTSAGQADSYVWSSRPLRADGPMSLWLVPGDAPGLTVAGAFDGLGLRGNASCPMAAERLTVPAAALLGADGAGLDLALAIALPRFLVLSAACSLGTMDAAMELTRTHLTRTRLSHLDQTLADQPTVRARYAPLRIRTDEVAAFLDDTVAALECGRADATLRVLQVKAVAAEAAHDVTSEAMRLCGGSALRRESGLERRFRDALAARVMAPTTDALYDFVARASLGLPVFGEAGK